MSKWIVSECAVARPELRIAPADSTINSRRLLVTDPRSIGVWSAFKAQSSYFPESLFPRSNPAWVVSRAILPWVKEPLDSATVQVRAEVTLWGRARNSGEPHTAGDLTAESSCGAGGLGSAGRNTGGQVAEPTMPSFLLLQFYLLKLGRP
jgi:hypothetical protein